MSEFVTRLEIFAREILESLLCEPEVLIITQMELLQGFRNGGESFVNAKRQLTDALAGYVTTAKEAGIVREDVDPAYVVGTLMDRIFNQAIYAGSLSQMYDVSISDPVYRAEWVRKTVDILVNGLRRFE